MKINLHWLQAFVDFKVDETELFSRLNTQLGEVESILDLKAKYDLATIVKVRRVENHPKTKNLTVCFIDDGQVNQDVKRQKDGLIVVVCGAKNVAKDMLAVWLPPQATVPNSYQTTKPFKLQVKEILGQLSYGMLASGFELGFSAQKDDILNLSDCFEPIDLSSDLNIEPVVFNEQLIGHSLVEVLNLKTKIIEIENKVFTHRPDCFGLIGLAREIAAITRSPFKRADWYYNLTPLKLIKGDNQTKVNLDVKAPNLVACFYTWLLEDLQIKPSHPSLQAALSSVGFLAINNVVDQTNLMMYLSGQPLHAFDYNKLLDLSLNPKKSLNLVVRQAKKDEKLQLLNQKTLDLKADDLVVATDKQPVALAGVMGGLSSEIDAQTQNVLLECAHFDLAQIRRTTMQHGIFSPAATRFTKNLNLFLDQTPPVGQKTAFNLSQFSAKPGEMTDFQASVDSSRIVKTKEVTVSVDFINQRLGGQLTLSEIVDLLKRVELSVVIKDDNDLKITPPYWRTDLAIAEDIVEEVGRLYNGYQGLPLNLPTHVLKPTQTNSLLRLKRQIREYLASLGANEVMNYSFVSKKFLKQAQQDEKQAFHLLNPLNPKLQVYRQSLTPSLIDCAQRNRLAGFKDFALFEIGCVHQKQADLVDDENLPIDLQRISFLCSLANSPKLNPFYTARRYLDLLGQNLRLKFNYQPYLNSQLDEALVAPYNLKQSALITVGQKDLGILGLFEGKNTYATWEIKTDVLLKAQRGLDLNQSTYRPISRYPKSSWDITLKVAFNLPFFKLQKTLDDFLNYCQSNKWQVESQLLSIFCPPKQQQFKNISFRLQFSHLEQNFKKEQVAQLVDYFINLCQKNHRAQQVV